MELEQIELYKMLPKKYYNRIDEFCYLPTAGHYFLALSRKYIFPDGSDWTSVDSIEEAANLIENYTDKIIVTKRMKKYGKYN